MLVTACLQPGTESAPSGIGDVSDIPIPSQDLSDDDDTSDGDDDDTSADDDDTSNGDDDSSPEPTSPVTYTLTDGDSLLYVQVFKDPNSLFSALAHDHVMRATNWTGTFQYDPADLSSCSFNVSIAADDMLVDEDGMRAYVGYSDTIGSNDRTTIRENMLAEGQLNSADFSQISVVSQTCGAGTGAGTSNGNLSITADMTIRGVNRTKSLVLALTIQNEEVYMQGSFTVNATEFGFSPYQFLGGGVRNLDEMTISFDMVGFPNN